MKRAAAVAVLGLGLPAAGCGGAVPAENRSPPPSQFGHDGVTHVSWRRGEYGETVATESRAALAATGARWGGLLVTWYMDSKSSSTIDPDPQKSSDDAELRRAIDEMHALGLQVMLKPHVDVRDGTWRAQITPADRARWFQSYGAFLDHYAALAAEAEVELLCIGTELASLSGAQDAAAWADLIARVRDRYRGSITYAAAAVEPADEFTGVSFWPLVDWIGLDVYTPLTGERHPTRAELAAGWRRNRYGHDMVAAFRNLHRAYGKPVLFTEIGYRSGDGTNRAPWDWQSAMSADPEEQADCYAAMYEVWNGESEWMKGPFWWAWDVDPPAAGDTGYSPRGKPAEQVLRLWHERAGQNRTAETPAERRTLRSTRRAPAACGRSAPGRSGGSPPGSRRGPC